jgi:hypothetical protein
MQPVNEISTKQSYRDDVEEGNNDFEADAAATLNCYYSRCCCPVRYTDEQRCMANSQIIVESLFIH